MMPTIRVTVDPAACIGAASCVGLAPRFFQLNEENRAALLDGEGDEGEYDRTIDVTAAEHAVILEAAKECPTTAITVEDAG